MAVARYRLLRRPAGSCWRVLAASCALVSLLGQSPLPWCHTHGTLADCPDAIVSWLSRHLQIQHTATADCCEAFAGWHIHFGYLGSTDDDPNDPSESEPERCPTICAAEGSSAGLERTLGGVPCESSALLTRQLAGPLPCRPGDLAGVTGFFETFAPTLPLPLRLCVARC